MIYLIDTLRADRMGCYGYDKPTSPTLDALAAKSVRFTRAYAPAPWTCPSVPSILTSTYLCEHGVIHEFRRLNPQIPTIASRFKQLNYHTASFFTNPLAGPATGMNQGFDICQEIGGPMPAVDGKIISQWAGRKPPGPFFLYLHNIEPHELSRASDELIAPFGSVDAATRVRLVKLIEAYGNATHPDWQGAKGLVNPLGTTNREPTLAQLDAELLSLLPQHKILYDALVHEADLHLKSVIDALQARGMWDDTLFIVLSDHGQELDDHGDYLHSQSVYEELARVPLIIHFPRDHYAGKTIADVVNLVDVLPTVFDFAGHRDLVGPARGQSLMPLIRAEGRTAREFVIGTVRDNMKKYRQSWRQRGNKNIAVLTPDGRWKGIWNIDTKTFELYDLNADPVEKQNRCHENADLVRRMHAFAKAFYADCGRNSKATQRETAPSAQEISKLKALGYVGGDERGPDAERAPASADSAAADCLVDD